MSHAPGPWRYEKLGWDGLSYLTTANGKRDVATLFSKPDNPSDIQLLTAAPELYEALERLIKSLLSNDTDCQATLREVLRGQAILERLKEDASQ